MKKLLWIVVLSLLWCSSSFADDNELNISIKKAVEETDVIKINEQYSMKCETELEDYTMIFSTKVVKSKILRSEAILDFGDDGSMYLKFDTKINSKGKLTKGAIKISYSPEIDKDLKTEIKNFESFIKEMASDSFLAFNIYGKTLLPIKTEDKKKSKKVLNMLKKMFAKDKEMKKFFQGLKLYSYDHYLGIADIETENFYVVKTYLKFSTSNEEFSEIINEMEESEGTIYTFIHVKSGFGIPVEEDSNMICTIYKQNKELIKVDTYELIY